MGLKKVIGLHQMVLRAPDFGTVIDSFNKEPSNVTIGNLNNWKLKSYGGLHNCLS